MSAGYATILKGLRAGAEGLHMVSAAYLEAMATEISQGFTTGQRFDGDELTESAEGTFGRWIDSPTIGAVSYNVRLDLTLQTGTSIEGIFQGTTIFEIPKQHRQRVRLTNRNGYIHIELIG